MLKWLHRFARGYTGRLLLGIMAIHAVVLPLLFFGLLHFAASEYKEDFVDHAREQAHLLETLVNKTADVSQVRALVEDLLLSGQVAYADFVPASGPTIRSELNAGSGPFLEDYFFGEHGDRIYFISVPAHGAVSGALRVGFDETPVVEHIDKSFRLGVALVAGYVVLTLLIVAVFGHRLTKSVRQLRDASRRIASGETEEQLAVATGVTEISDLAGDLELMRRELKRREQEIALRETRQRAILDTAAEGIITTNNSGRIESFNQAAEAIFGYSAEEVIGTPFLALLCGKCSPERCGTGRCHAARLPITCVGAESVGTRKNGEEFNLTLSVSEATVAGITCSTILLQDVSERHAFESQLAHMATHDALTGLCNRRLYNEQLTQVLAHAERAKSVVGLIFLDLDRFKRINDTLGHSVGDELLKEVGVRLHRAVRREDILARLGGDEFTLILPTLRSPPDAAVVAQNILKELERPFSIGNRELFVSGSLGISLYPEDGRDADELAKNADTAMYVAKSKGGGNFQFYSEQMNARANVRLEMETRLRYALENGEIHVHYQPQVDARNRRIVGVEALARWQHPQLGMVSPAEFIPLAEETGLIVPLSEWVLRTACLQGREWQEQGLGITVAVNLSARQFNEPTLFETISTILLETGFSPKLLDLELTEGTVMRQGGETLAVLERLRRLGIQVSLDDFGTGYSSLSYLKRFPIDILKIDRSFVQDIGEHRDGGESLAAVIIAMGRSLKMKVIGEGVETEEQLEYLRQHGCDVFQGYYFSRPVDAEALTQLLRDNHASHPQAPAAARDVVRQLPTSRAAARV
jgi:diguanylate cyclase (GGDEF)-like protein/PAS domain S-box-containing protein